MLGGDLLVHSNETCGAGGMGGFEVYDVDDPRNPVHLFDGPGAYARALVQGLDPHAQFLQR
jgi:hypothetical protein